MNTEEFGRPPFMHPAAKRANQLFLELRFDSEEGYRKSARRDRYLWDVSWFETQVENGGVDQFFFNSTGDRAIETLEALRAIGADDSARLVEAAVALFPGAAPDPDTELSSKLIGCQFHVAAGARF